MAIFKCKMCGGALEVQEDQTMAICDYCGTRQTLPRLSSDRRANLYDRANHFRRGNEYDKAAGIYEQLLNEDATDAEAYWSLVLCRYGIEYVDDPATHRRIPTVNRAQFTSIFDDDNYRSALAHADASQRGIYEREAAAIDELRRGILEISQREAPFDVFLCYKEADQSGRRTPDSVLAGELYRELTDAGYRVFFSRVTLEDKPGTAYEPYIFAALQSARVMVALGTRPESFHAVWVRNEWSRYLALIRNGARKVLIPAYRDMDPYDLPEEFSHLQARDMGKPGFVQDLLRDIGKLAAPAAAPPAQPEQPIQPVQPEQQVQPAAASAPLLRRAFLFLEDGEWDSANEYCERALDIDPENAEAYVGKLMAELQCPRREALQDCAKPFDGLDSYKKALRFGDEGLRAELQGAVAAIRKRNESAAAANKAAQLAAAYDEAVRKMQAAAFRQSYLDAAALFDRLPGYRDADALAAECRERAQQCVYDAARELMRAAKTAKDYQAAAREFARIPGFRDADALTVKCQERSAALKRRRRRRPALAVAIVAVVAVAAAAIALFGPKAVSALRYHSAEKLLKTGQYEDAMAAFEALDAYGDAADRVLECRYAMAEDLAEAGQYAKAAIAFGKAAGYRDAGERSAALWEDIVPRASLAVGLHHIVGLCADGTVLAAGWDDDGRCYVSGWKDIVAVAAGESYTVGLRADGTVVATGWNYYGQCDISGRMNVVAIAAGSCHSVGLRKDGTVIATGWNDYGQCDVSDWKDVVAIAAGGYHSVGLRKDGTVIATGNNSSGQCDVSDWKDVVAIDAGLYYTVGLCADGTVIATGWNDEGQCDVSGWKGVVAIAAGDYHTVGLRADGTVLAAGWSECGQCDFVGWTDVVAIAAGNYHTVGLRNDGTVLANGWSGWGDDDLPDVTEWTDIRLP